MKTTTAFPQLNAGGVYLKLGLVDLAFIRSSRHFIQGPVFNQEKTVCVNIINSAENNSTLFLLSRTCALSDILQVTKGYYKRLYKIKSIDGK